MRRFVTRLLWLAVWVAVIWTLLLYTPLGRITVAIRLWTQELQPPLTVPVQGVRAAALNDTWGASRSNGRTHEGIDIFARCGHPVVSATEGLVVGVGENNLGGRTVWVMGPGGSRHYYAHLSRYAEGIGAGDHVLPGTVLGYVGNTGNARTTPCHLHYGIYMGGGATNPFPFLVRR